MLKRWNIIFLVIFLMGFISRGFAEDIKLYTDEEITMSIPKSLEVVEERKDYSKAWSGPYMVWSGPSVTRRPVEIRVMKNVGGLPKEEEIANFLFTQTKTQEEDWQLMDSAKSRKGWIWKKTYTATIKNTSLIATFGQGVRGSFIILLKTTASDFNRNGGLYDLWFSGIRLHDNKL